MTRAEVFNGFCMSYAKDIGAHLARAEHLYRKICGFDLPAGGGQTVGFYVRDMRRELEQAAKALKSMESHMMRS